MNTGDDLNSPLGQLGSVPKKTGEQLVKEPFETAEKVEEQTGVKPTASKKPPSDASDGTDIPSQKATLEIVKKMYEASNAKMSVPSDKVISAVIQENPKKTPEEIQKIAVTRQQLLQQQHMTTYFEPTFNPPKKNEPRVGEATKEEEDKKKQMEALELDKKEKKKEELSPAVKQGTVEKNPGISG